MGFTVETGISAAAVFVQGLLSFFSPCVLPLVPLYLGYLAGGLNVAAEAGSKEGQMAGTAEKHGERGNRLRLFLRVFCFTLGISGAFFVLGLGASAAGSFFREQRMLFARIGGILIILFGLYQIGLFGSSRLLGKEHRIPLRLEKMTMSPVTALIMGFTFSFAWTPCVGPALTSVLLMAGSSQTSLKGFLLIGVYTLGFILPFLAAGIFTAQLLGFFWKLSDKFKRFSADRCVYPGIYSSVSCSGNLYGTAAGLFQEAHESGAVYRENRGSASDSYGCPYVYRKDE